MRKKIDDKLALSRETLGTLTHLDLFAAQGGGGTSTTGQSNSIATCATCFGVSCNLNPTTATGTSACC
jgi:hypothetical protein